MTQQDRLNGLVGSLAIKAPCQVATTANITLTGLQTIDGVLVVEGDYVLVKDQTDTTENGIYVADTGDWERRKDFDGAYDVTKGTIVLVNGGTVGVNTYWRLTTAGTVTFGTSNITFEKALFGDAAILSFLQAGVAAVVRALQTKVRESMSIKDFGAVGDGVTNDTAAWLAFKTALRTTGQHGLIPSGTYLIDAFSFTAADAGLRLSGEAYNPQASAFGVPASVLKLRSASAAFVTHTGCYNMEIENITFDGGKFADVVHEWPGLVNVVHTVYRRCVIGGATATTGKTIHFGGSVGGDNNYYEHCNICSSPNSSANPPLHHVHNENTNAFLIEFSKCRFGDAITMFRYGTGSCSLIRCDVFGATTRYFQIDAITQPFKLIDVYTEGSTVPFLTQGLLGTGVKSNRPITIENCNLNAANDIVLNCQQPVRLLGVVTGGNIDVTPVATWGLSYVYAESLEFVDVANTWTGAGALTRVTSINETRNGVVQPYLFPAAQLNVASGVRSAAGATASIASGAATTIVALGAEIGRWEFQASIPGSGTNYTAFATVIAEGTAARLVASNGGNLTITLSGTNVQVTQTAGFAAIVNWSMTKMPGV